MTRALGGGLTEFDFLTLSDDHTRHIADVIRQVSARPRDDLSELWQRMVFTVLISNTDDHLKNHGFIYIGSDRWRLSPAFDINPAPLRQRTLQTCILEGEPFDASLELALAAAAFFELADRAVEKIGLQRRAFPEAGDIDLDGALRFGGTVYRACRGWPDCR